MTHHPRRRRDVTGEAERDLAAAEALAGDVLPAGEGGIPPQGSAEVHAGRTPLLVANAAMIPAMLGQLAGIR